MKSKSFGVIIDEAHSSTSGEDLKAVKKALNLGVDVEDIEDAVTENMKQTGRQANVAMFAFTATPKPKHSGYRHRMASLRHSIHIQ